MLLHLSVSHSVHRGPGGLPDRDPPGQRPPGQRPPRQRLPDRDPPYGNKRAVYILLECILV